jgi:hypothetical protein
MEHHKVNLFLFKELRWGLRLLLEAGIGINKDKWLTNPIFGIFLLAVFKKR